MPSLASLCKTFGGLPFASIQGRSLPVPGIGAERRPAMRASNPLCGLFPRGEDRGEDRAESASGVQHVDLVPELLGLVVRQCLEHLLNGDGLVGLVFRLREVVEEMALGAVEGIVHWRVPFAPCRALSAGHPCRGRKAPRTWRGSLQSWAPSHTTGKPSCLAASCRWSIQLMRPSNPGSVSARLSKSCFCWESSFQSVAAKMSSTCRPAQSSRSERGPLGGGVSI